MKQRKVTFDAATTSAGAYRFARWRNPAPNLLLVHGMTSSYLSWPRVIRSFSHDYDLIAPDLRGRGQNSLLPPPYGLDAHVEDLCASLDHCEIEKTIFVGHSLGAYIGLKFAHRYPQRVHALVLVDGGIALPLPPGKTAEETIKGILGPALTRLAQTFANNAAYREFWRAHPAFQDPDAWNTDIEAYIDYDLQGEPPSLRSRVNPQAVKIDSYGPLDPKMPNLIDSVEVPMLLLTAPRGLMNQDKPLLPVTEIATKCRINKQLQHVNIDDTNHYSIVLGAGAARVAAEIDRFVAALNLS